MSIDDGLLLFHSGKMEDAIRKLEEALETETSHVKGLYTLGICYFRLKQFAKAKAIFNQVIDLEHRYHLAHYYIGLIYERQGQEKDAFLEYQIALTIHPDFPEAKQKLEGMNTNPDIRNIRPKSVPPPEFQNTNTPNDDIQNTNDAVGDLVAQGHRRMRSFSFLFVLGILTIPLLGLGIVILLFIFVYARATEYTIYEKRIDATYGVFFRKFISIWLFQVEDVWLKRSFFNLITRDASIQVQTSNLEGRTKSETELSRIKITGLGGIKEMRRIWQIIRDRSIEERIEKKKFLV